MAAAVICAEVNSVPMAVLLFTCCVSCALWFSSHWAYLLVLLRVGLQLNELRKVRT